MTRFIPKLTPSAHRSCQTRGLSLRLKLSRMRRVSLALSRLRWLGALSLHSCQGQPWRQTPETGEGVEGVVGLVHLVAVGVAGRTQHDGALVVTQQPLASAAEVHKGVVMGGQKVGMRSCRKPSA